MMQDQKPTQDPNWVLTHEGYNVLTENAVEFPFCTRQRVPRNAGLAPGQPWPDMLMAPSVTRPFTAAVMQSAARSIP